MYSASLHGGVIPRKKKNIRGILVDFNIYQLQFDVVILTNISFKEFLCYCYEKTKVPVFKTGFQADKFYFFSFLETKKVEI